MGGEDLTFIMPNMGEGLEGFFFFFATIDALAAAGTAGLGMEVAELAAVLAAVALSVEFIIVVFSPGNNNNRSLRDSMRENSCACTSNIMDA